MKGREERESHDVAAMCGRIGGAQCVSWGVTEARHKLYFYPKAVLLFFCCPAPGLERRIEIILTGGEDLWNERAGV